MLITVISSANSYVSLVAESIFPPSSQTRLRRLQPFPEIVEPPYQNIYTASDLKNACCVQRMIIKVREEDIPYRHHPENELRHPVVYSVPSPAVIKYNTQQRGHSYGRYRSVGVRNESGNIPNADGNQNSHERQQY